MKVLSVSRLICLLFLAIPLGSAGAVMVDFESPEYTAGAPFDGVDGWAHWGAYAGATVVTPDASGTGDTTVLAGAQSGRVSNGLGILYRYFDAGPDGFDTGSIVSGRLQLGGADGSAELFYSNAPASAGTPAGIIANVGGNFQLFGGAAGNYVDSGVPSSSGVSYFLEMELDLDAQTFTGYATPEGGARTLLGTTPFIGVIPKDAYPDSGFILVTRGSAIGVYDDLDVYVVDPDPPVPLLPEPVDFEADVYVAGESVVGVDGWSEAIWPADGMVTDATVLEGTKSLRLTGSPNAILQRNLGEGTVVDDGYIVSTVMMAEGPDDGNAEFHYSHNQDALSTPAGIVGKLGGNFWVFGLLDGEVVSPGGIETDVPFESNVEYLLEMVMNFTGQTFKAYATDLTNGGERTLLGEAEYWFDEATSGPVVPTDGTNAGYIVVTRGGAVAYYDAFNCAIPEPGCLVLSVLGLLGVLAIRRRK